MAEGHVADGALPAHEFDVRLRDILVDARTNRARLDSRFRCPVCGFVPMRLIADLDDRFSSHFPRVA